MTTRSMSYGQWVTGLSIALWLGLAGVAPGADRNPLEGVHRVVFLGDSITYAGQYVEYVEAYLRLKFPEFRSEFIDLGLPSETVSGLTEPGHAGGAFPRPDLHERLDRVLAKTKPDWIVACYGMNDGIYYPFAEERLAKFQEGVRDLHTRAEAAGAKVLHVTPPVFDPVPIKARTLPAGLSEYRQPFEGYNATLDRYAEWLMAQKAKGWDVVDVHGPMNRHLTDRRKRDAAYRLADDGVHINDTGHWLIARTVLTHWVGSDQVLGEDSTPKGVFSAFPKGTEVLRLVQQRQRLLKDAWLTEVGHLRPGMAKGLPLKDAEQKAAGLDAEIRRRLERR